MVSVISLESLCHTRCNYTTHFIDWASMYRKCPVNAVPVKKCCFLITVYFGAILKIYLSVQKSFNNLLKHLYTPTRTVFILFLGNKDASRVSISTFIINSYRQTCLWSEIHGWREICLLYGINWQRDVVLFFWFPRRSGNEARRLKVHWGPLPVIIMQD